MTTAADLIAYLQTLPPDTLVTCGYEVTSGYTNYMAFGPIDIGPYGASDYFPPVRHPVGTLVLKSE